MKGESKGILLPVLVVVIIISFIFAFNVNAQANKYKKLFEKEMAFRLDMEEKVSNSRNEKINLTIALKDKDLEIQKKDQLIENLNQAISQKDSEISQKDSEINRIQSELQKSNLLKQRLEEDLAQELTKPVTETSE